MENKQMKIKLGTLTVLCCAIIFAVITFIIEPISVITLSDITLSSTILPRFVSIVLELAETAAFALCYSVIIFASVTRTQGSGFAFLGIYAAACLVRRVCVLCITYFTYNYIDSTDIFSVCTVLVFEYVMAIAVTLVASIVGKHYRADLAELKKAARIAGDSSNVEIVERPEFTSVFSKHNPLQLCMLVSGIMLSAVKLGMRINSDIKYNSFYGAPSSVSEILIMVVYYLSDILVCAIFYALSWLITAKLCKNY